MKLNFFGMLQRDSKPTSEDLAAEILNVQDAIAAGAKDLESAEAECFRLKHIELGGGKVSKSEVETASKKRDDANLELDALKSALRDLKRKLADVILSEREDEIARLKQVRQELREELPALRQKLILKAAELDALCQAINTEGQWAQYFFLQSLEDRQLFQETLLECRAKITKPTHADREKACRQRWDEINGLSVEKAIENALKNAAADRAGAKVA
jgi:hypothetical protein